MLTDGRVSGRRRAALALLVAYLVSPIDLIPDFLPAIGALDDALLVVLVLRYVLRGGQGALLREHWPGPPNSMALLERVVLGPPSRIDPG